MTPRAVSYAGAALAAIALAGCGFDRPEPPPHGLTLEALVSSPTGDPVEAVTDVRPGRWKVEVEKAWRRRRGPQEQEGHAVLDLLAETLAQDSGWETHYEVRVRRAQGIAEDYVRGFDGLRFHLTHDASGRPDPATLRFDAIAPAGARMFLWGFWPAGLVGATPWFPARKLRVGETWGREALGGLDRATSLVGAEDARLVPEGGGRLEAVTLKDGEPTMDVRLESLVTVDGERIRRGEIEPLRLGIRDRGRATFRVRDGIPLVWTLVEDIVILETVDGGTERTKLTLTVEGRTTQR